MLVANRRNPWAISSLFFYYYELLKRNSLIHPVVAETEDAAYLLLNPLVMFFMQQ
jgi:hypothetical protein